MSHLASKGICLGGVVLAVLTLAACGGGSSKSSSFCADLKNFWFAPDGLENAFVAVQVPLASAIKDTLC
jgi:hypothetical protein